MKQKLSAFGQLPTGILCILIICIICILFAFFPAPACSREGGTSEITDGKNGKTLCFGLSLKGMDNFDPHFADKPQERTIAEMLFNRLIRYKPGNTNILEPDLAENIPEPEIIDGKQVWAFHLKKGVMFHARKDLPSYEMTSDDVVASLNKSIHSVNPLHGGNYSGMSVEKTDRYTVRIIMERPLSATLFMPRLAAYPGGFIVSGKAAVKKGYDYFKRHPVGTGPFVFNTHVPGNNLVLKANEKYFRGSPLTDRVKIYFIPDIMERESGLTSGNLDIIEGIHDAGWVRIWQQQPGINVDLSGMGEVAMLHFNLATEPLNDVRVRKAIAYALDRGLFSRTFGEGILEDIYAPIPAGFLAGGMSQKQVDALDLEYRLNLQKAVSLMKEAGYEKGFSLTLNTSEDPTYRRYYESMRDQLARIGIDCKIKKVKHAAMHMLIRQNANPLVIYIAWRPDADANLTRLFHSDAIPVKGPSPDTNFSHYRQVDRIIEAARYETDPQKQAKLWNYAQIKILDDMAAYPLHYLHPAFARKTRVDLGYEVVTPADVYPRITEKTVMRIAR